MKRIVLFLLIVIFCSSTIRESSLKIAVLKYNGGGDWYANPTSLPNLAKFCNATLGTEISEEVDEVDIGSKQIFNYPFLHMTGHGNVVWNEEERDNLKRYLLSGGFLHIDDNYGMDPFIRPILDNLFPGSKLRLLSDDHELFLKPNFFEFGLPKIHEHDENPAEAYGIEVEGRMVLLYTFESDLGDGWEDAEVHNDTKEKRLEALKMGANIIDFVFTRN
jgi:hypothetical protein